MPNLLDCREGEDVNVLEVGYGLGATLARIQFVYPNARVYEIESGSKFAAIGSSALNIVQGDIFMQYFQSHEFVDCVFFIAGKV